MATEIELKLALPAAAAPKLAAQRLLSGIPCRRQRLENTYYDTPSLALLARLVAVRRRRKNKQWLLTVKSAEPASGGLAQRSEWERPALPDDLDFSMVDNAELRQTLEKNATLLTPVFTTHFTRLVWHLDFAGARIELALDRGRIESGNRRTPICEIELELLDGEISGLFALARALQEDLPLHPSTKSKAERGYALFLNSPARPGKAAPCQIAGETPAITAFRQIALNCLDHLQRNESGIRQSLNPDFLHQARIALRRLRSNLKLFAGALPSEFVRHYSEQWRHLANALNASRNWDVLATETLPPLRAAFPDAPDIVRLQSACHRAARDARRDAARHFAEAHYSRLLLDFSAALFALPQHPSLSFAEITDQYLRRRAQQARKLAKHLHTLDAGALHQLRITYKKLRYALEFTPPGKGRKPYLATLAHLQEALGNINDLVTARQLLDQLQPRIRSHTARGWIAGCHALRLAALPEAIRHWLKQTPPWKYS